MTTNYKILGQGVNSLKIDAPENGSTILSELKIKNTSYPTSFDVFAANSGEEKYQFSVDQTFDTSDIVTYGEPLAGVVLDDDSIVLGGDKSNDSFYFFKLNKNGSWDTEFLNNAYYSTDPAAEITATATIQGLEKQPDGKILVSANFKGAGTLDIDSNLIRLNSDGTLDRTFNFTHNTNFFVRAKVQPDGKIIVAGNFDIINGIQVNQGGSGSASISRLNSDGSLDTSFNATMTNGIPDVFIIQPDGKIIVAPDDTFGSNDTLTIDGIQRPVFRLNSDGSRDTSFNLNASGSGQFQPLVLQPDGKIFMKTPYNAIIDGEDRTDWARINADGSLDTTFAVTNLNTSSNGYLRDAYVQPDGKIIIAGYFWAEGDFPFNRIARLNSDGSIDDIFTPINIRSSDQYFNSGDSVNLILELSSGDLVLGGDFQLVDEYSSDKIVKLNESIVTNSNNYLVKNKEISYDEEVRISGGIALESGQSLVVDTGNNSDTVIIQAYGIEETA